MDKRFYTEAGVFDLMDELVYISDLETNEMLFANQSLCQYLNVTSYEGRKCYDMLQGRSSPCPFCTNARVIQGEKVQWSYYNPVMKKYFRLKDRPIQFRGRPARLEIAFETTEYELQKSGLTQALEREEFLTHCVRKLEQATDLSAGVQTVLQDIGVFLQADRSYIFSLSQGRMHNTYEWCREGVSPQLQKLQDMDIHIIDRWMTYFNRHESVVVTDVETIRQEAPEEYDVMTAQDIHTYVTTPIEIDHVFSGFIGVDNPPIDRIRNIGPLLVSLSYVLVSSYKKIRNQKLLENEKSNLEQLITHIPAGICVFSRKNEGIFCVTANPYYAELLGMDRTELIGKPWALFEALVHPQDRQRHRQETVENLDRHRKTEGTYRFFHKKYHRYVWLHLEGRLILHGDGRELAYYCYTDVTIQKQREQQYQQSMQELSMTNPLSVGTFRLNLTKGLCYEAHGLSAFLVPALQQSKEIPLHMLVDEIVERLPNEEDKAQFQKFLTPAALQQKFFRGQADESLSYRLRYRDGEIHWIETYIHMVQHPVTGDIEAITYSENIDDKMWEQQLLQRVVNDRYDYVSIIHIREKTLEFGYVGVHVQNRLEGLSIRKGDVFDYDYICAKARKWIADEDWEKVSARMPIAALQRQLEHQASYQYDIQGVKLDGSFVCKQLRYSYFDESHQHILVEQADITKLYLAQKEKLDKEQTLRQAAIRANELKSEFLSNVSHDMRTPLNGIIGYTNLARQEKALPVVKNYLEKINESGLILKQLINDMLDLNRLETGIVPLKLSTARCGDVLQRVQAAVQPAMDEKQLHFELDSRKAPQQHIRIDMLRVEQVLINLLSNAIKFTPAGGQAGCVVECQNEDEQYVYCCFTVYDTGIGISPAFLPKAFEPLSQERNEYTSHIGGSGLGLTMARRYAEMMGGRIEIDSTLGKGTQVQVYLAFEKAQPPAGEKAPGQKTWHLAGKRVLLCEDNDLNTEIACMILQGQGVEVVCAPQGQRGVEIFEASSEFFFDAILMDLRMPVMNGYEAAKVIRRMNRKDAKIIPIIAVSADAYESDIKKSLACGMNSHVSKPINTEKLYDELERLCP